MKDLLIRSSVVIGVVTICVLLFAPNFLEQELAIAFKQEYRTRVDGKIQKFTIGVERVQDFVKDRENGLGLFFPGAPCVFKAQDGIPKTHRCVLRGRFITAARINEMAQAYPRLIDELRTGVLPHPLERFFGMRTKAGFKNLKVRLGLDLQGGMRAVFRADYDAYSTSLREKYLPRVDKLQKDLKKEKDESKKNDIRVQLDNIRTQLDMNRNRKLELLKEARAILNKRLTSLNLSEPEVRTQEDSYSIGVDMPGVTNSSGVMSQITQTATVEYRIVDDAKSQKVDGAFRKELEEIKRLYVRGRVKKLEVQEIFNRVLAKSGLDPRKGEFLRLNWRRGQRKTSRLLPREWMVVGPVVLDGDDMTNAQPSIDPQSGYHMIHFELSPVGAATFGDITTKNLKKRLAILWSGRIVSAPVIQGPILGGNGQITGEFTKKEATEISAVIREGALPLPLEVISVSFVGPSLGQESIVAGVISILAGFILVIIFMVGYYKAAGAVANLALFMNLLLIAAALSLLEFTLTLPGFAGVILVVGMAVDANVIIYEKIKEELRLGKPPSVAIEAGFGSSFWTILDANVTTLIAAIILWKVGKEFGDSAIMGFSVTLFVGLLSSMFTALFVSRLVFDWVLYFRNLQKLSIGYGFQEQEQA